MLFISETPRFSSYLEIVKRLKGRRGARWYTLTQAQIPFVSTLEENAIPHVHAFSNVNHAAIW